MSPVDSKKIDILMMEYESLRTEILARINSRFVLLGMVGAFIGFTFFSESSTLSKLEGATNMQWSVCLVGGAVLLVVWLWMGFLLAALAKRVSEIEKKINDLAGVELLEWESKHGYKIWGRWLQFRKPE